HHRPRPRDRGRARGRGGADRQPGRGADPRRGARSPGRHDQLRDHLWNLGPGAASAGMTIEQRLEGAPALRLAREAIEGTEGVWVVGGAVRAAALDRDVDDLDLTVPEGEEGVAR